MESDTLWSTVFSFFEKRIDSRYLKPIKAIEDSSSLEGEGFSIVAILCSLIEALETFRSGKVFRRPSKDKPLDSTKEYFKNQEIFESFLANRYPFNKNFSIDGLATNFYQNVRCPVLYEAAIRNGWKIQINTSSLITIRENEIILNRTIFVEDIDQYIKSYKVELSTSNELKNNFIQKMN